MYQVKIKALAGSTTNKSHFDETSVEVCQALAQIVSRLRSKKLTLKVAMEEIEDIWTAEFDESIPFESAQLVEVK